MLKPLGKRSDLYRRTERGCFYYPDCLACPFPHCRLDTARPDLLVRNQEIKRRRAEGESLSRLAFLYGLSYRQVERILAKSQREESREAS